MQIPIVIRPRKQSDIPHIMAVWKNCVLRSNNYRWCEKGDFYAYFNYHCEYILNNAQVSAAVAEHDDDFILAFLVYDPRGGNVAHFIHTKEPYRKYGIAKSLLTKAGFNLNKPVIATHWGDDLESVCRAKPGCLIYAPSKSVGESYIAMRKVMADYRASKKNGSK